MFIQTAILAWLFLDGPLTAQEMVGVGLAAVGILVVQLKRRRSGE